MSLEAELKDFKRFQKLMPERFLRSDPSANVPKMSKKQQKKLEKQNYKIVQNNVQAKEGEDQQQPEYTLSELKDKLHTKIQQVRQAQQARKEKKLLNKKIQKNKDKKPQQQQKQKTQQKDKQGGKDQQNKGKNNKNKGVAGFDGKRKNKFKH